MTLRLLLAFALTWLSLSPVSLAQEAVPVGGGSYASFPPKGKVMDGKRKVDLVEETEQRKLYLVKDDGRPIPSNKWYQNLLFQQYGTGLWAMPHTVDATPEGIEIFHPTTFDASGSKMISEFPLILSGKDFKPTDSRAKFWSDWMVSFRMPENENRHLEVTLGQGMPYVWVEFAGVAPKIAFGGTGGKGSRGKNGARYFDLAGKETALPVTGDALGITYEGRHFGLFAPDGTSFKGEEGAIQVEFSGKATYLVVCPLPSAKDIGLFHKHAFAIPRDTQLAWDYDRKAGTITTTWKVTTEQLKGTEKRLLQGWLPHHWRENTAPLELSGPTYATIRGPMKCSIGDTFTLRYPYYGVVPNLPLPDAKSGFQTQRIKTALNEHFADEKSKFATDTYAGGKDLERFAQAAFMAAQTKDPNYEVIVAKVRGELANWLTYTPGEKDRYFAYYPRRKGLIGFNVSYGSQHFTDHHFHNGYFVFTAGLLSQLQPDFAKEYGEMARLVAKTYANYERADARFPYFRTFDLWRGHSFADGKGFPEGNNQESTGEAINSWVGMILLGEALGDKELTAAGVMGYTFESRANVEYWFDPHGDVFPAAFPHNACGMIWCDRIVWGTWFTASPGWIYGIQWIPSGPYYSFYDRDLSFIKKTYADLLRELDSFEENEAKKKPGYVKKPAGVKSQGGELGSYHLGFVMHADPAWVVGQLDELYAEPGDKIAHDAWMANIYYQACALKDLGRVDATCRGDSPTSMVYRNEATSVRTYIAWNPTAKSQTVQFFDQEKPLGKLEVAPHSLGSASKLAP